MCTDCKYVPWAIQILVPALQTVPNQHSTNKPSKRLGQLATLKYWNRHRILSTIITFHLQNHPLTFTKNQETNIECS